MLKGESCIYFSCYCSNAENNHALQNSNSNKNNKIKETGGFWLFKQEKRNNLQLLSVSRLPWLVKEKFEATAEQGYVIFNSLG